jgi:hypothetical protein
VAGRGHRVRINLDETEGADLVRRLAEDAEFYAAFKANPQQVLAENNVEVSGPMTPTSADVPPQEEIQQLLTAAEGGLGLAEGAIEPAGHPVFKMLFAFPFSAEQ